MPWKAYSKPGKRMKQNKPKQTKIFNSNSQILMSKKTKHNKGFNSKKVKSKESQLKYNRLIPKTNNLIVHNNKPVKNLLNSKPKLEMKTLQEQLLKKKLLYRNTKQLINSFPKNLNNLNKDGIKTKFKFKINQARSLL